MGRLLKIPSRGNGLIPRRGVRMGREARIDPRVRFRGSGIRLGDSVSMLRGTEILGPVTIGAETFLNRDVYVRAHTTIGERVSIGPFTRIVSDTHEQGTPERRAGRPRFDPIVIGSGAWIGANVTILGGVTIGPGSVIAAGSVVTRDVEPHAMYAGVPAVLKRRLPS